MKTHKDKPPEPKTCPPLQDTQAAIQTLEQLAECAKDNKLVKLPKTPSPAKQLAKLTKANKELHDCLQWATVQAACWRAFPGNMMDKLGRKEFDKNLKRCKKILGIL